MNPLYVGVLYIFGSAVGFGVMSIFAVYAYEAGVSVSTLLFLRFLLATALFFGLLLWRKESLRLDKKQVLAMFCLGGILYTLQSLSFFSAVQYIPTSMAALLLYTFPVFVAILSYFVEKERLTKKTVIAMLITLVGLGLVLGLSFGGIQPVGVLLALAAALFYSVYIVVGNRVVKGVSSYVTSAYIALFATISTFFIALKDGGVDLSFAVQGWWALLGIVVFSTVVAISFFFRGLQLIGSTKASVLSTLEPVVTFGFSALLFGEAFSLLQLLGGCAVLVGAALIVSGKGGEPELAPRQASS
ncbi:threonine/homoserine efflux transporter RhtA [Brevibacillus sp. AG162]|uniref:DMT family transporter n=1 Tax=Brevibacillus sp. AG162 TaxID=2572910 RepID=UPI00114DDE0F|nr:DMT family transporter [Brevibacillus sp. AG162]TQK62036.1 threonine/homoserine efflux transporter RhtA [Brevibacillus sp. AG162]